MAYADFTITITNGSKQSLNAQQVFVNTSYGKNGEEAKMLFLNDQGDISGKILPGKSKTGHWGYLIPEAAWGDVVVEVWVGDNFERDPVVFAGSIK